MVQECSTIKSAEVGTHRVGAEIPLITKTDYGKRLMLIPLKAEEVDTHSIDILRPEKSIACEDPCPLCRAGIPCYSYSLMPVYNVEDEIIQILPVDSDWYPGSLSVGLFCFSNQCFRMRTLLCRTPFLIFPEEPPDGFHPCAPEFRHFPLFRITPGVLLWGDEEIAAKKDCISRFIKDYRYGDLVKSASIHMHAVELEDSLKLINVEDYLGLISSFPGITKNISRIA